MACPKPLAAPAAAFDTEREGFTFEKFVIPNPFGPYEEPRFTAYLMKTWLAGETARVQTPRYVRDNIHVRLLAKAYAGFVGAGPPLVPCGGSARAVIRRARAPFAERVRREAAACPRLRCRLELATQTEFPEPAVRINTDLLDWKD
jgi:hypothetical protein